MNWKRFFEGESSTKRMLLYIGGGAAGVLLTAIILINLLLIASNIREPNQMPSVFGIRPAIVLSGSMAPTFQPGDVILLKKTRKPEALEVGDVACYLYSGKATTHRVIERFEADGKPRYIMKGDYNNVEDRLAVDPEQIQGVWTGGRIPGLGRVLMFMQSTMGMFLLLICPLAGILSWDIWKRRRGEQRLREGWEDGVFAEIGAAEPSSYPEHERKGRHQEEPKRFDGRKGTYREEPKLFEAPEERRRSEDRPPAAYDTERRRGSGRRRRQKDFREEWEDEFAYYSSQEDFDYYEDLEEAAEHYRRMKESLTRFQRMESLMKRCRRLEEELIRYEELAKRLEIYERRDRRPAARSRPVGGESPDEDLMSNQRGVQNRMTESGDTEKKLEP